MRASARAPRCRSAAARSSSPRSTATATSRRSSRRPPSHVARERIVDVRGVTKRYGDRVVVAGLDCAFDRGALTAVTGPSGSGKTTLLDVVAGLELPDDGTVDLLGTDVDVARPRRPLRPPSRARRLRRAAARARPVPRGAGERRARAPPARAVAGRRARRARGRRARGTRRAARRAPLRRRAPARRDRPRARSAARRSDRR